MICFNCGINLHNNESKECQMCGVKFALICPCCNFPNPSMGKFCFNCGNKITGFEDGSLVRNFDTLSENRRNVAVIFADVSGFTALSEKMDPEEVRELINDCFSYITKPVYELEGTIDKYIGDCVMILFGARYIHSDDAKRAVLCSIRMLELIREFSEERLSNKGLELTLSIGINFGLVVTGSVGNEFDRDYTVMGDIVNTAQRLQSNAKRGTILVSESVFMQTEDLIEYSGAEEIRVKNRENLVRCYIPIKIKAEHSYGRRDAFVGRQKELNLLVSIYNNALNTGSCCVNIIGEAGVGKTSLLKEFYTSIGSDVKKVWIDLNTFSFNRVYQTISSLLMNIMNINPNDSVSVKQRRLMSFLDYILGGSTEEEIERNYDFLGFVLGLPRDNEFQSILNSMTFEGIRREIIKQLSVFFSNLSKKYRMIIAIDDLHWSDNNSLYILKELIKTLKVSNIMFTFSSRYENEEFKSLADGKDTKCQTLQLRTLDENGVRELLVKRLGCIAVDNKLFELVQKFTNGNPLYICEFVQNIKRAKSFSITNGVAGIDENEVTSLPQNIQSLILSNLSELDELAKSFLQAASVAGREFNLSVISAVLKSSSDELSDMLRLPVNMNIISLKTVYTTSGVVERVFMFNQDMEREVIYDSILNKNKKELHKKIGEIIEARYSKEIEDYYEILFTHFNKAGNIKKAAGYSFKTAIKNKNNYNFSSSLIYYKEFLKLTKDRSGNEGSSEILAAYKDIGYINLIMANYDQALENLNTAISYAKLYDEIYEIKLFIAEVYKEQDLYDNALLILDEIQPKIKQENNLYGKLLQMKCCILRILGNPEALSIAKKSGKLLAKTKDYENLSETMNQAGIIYYTRGEISESLSCLGKSYKYAEKINNLAIMAKVSGNLGAIYHATGMISKAQEYFNKSIYVSRKISDQQGYIAGCINLGILYMDKGLFSKAEVLFQEAIGISREIASRLNESIALTNIGDIMYERGNKDKALEYYNDSLAIAKEINVPMGEGINYISCARLYMEMEDFEKVPEMLEKASNIFIEAGEIAYLGDYHRYKALYQLMTGDIKGALYDCGKAVSISEEIKSDIRKLKALRLKASIFTSLEDIDSALDLLTQSITLSHQLESDYEAAKGYLRRIELYRLKGETDKAKKDLTLAKECISKVDICRVSEKIENYRF
ncbi:MAG: tetratricopeptide repeat protein [Clostridiaceae bacterium]|nr:tetratricopeptide repeat protein [Clostridiaceae bacterium]